MAAIDIVGNTVIVTAAGTLGIEKINVVSAAVWWTNTATGDIQIVDISTGSILVRRFTAVQSPKWEFVPMEGAYGQLSFNTVTAGTLTFTLG